MQDFNNFYEPDPPQHEEVLEVYQRPGPHPQGSQHRGPGQRRFHQDQNGGFSDIFAPDQRKTTAAPFKSGFK